MKDEEKPTEMGTPPLIEWAFAPMSAEDAKAWHDEVCENLRILAGLPDTARVTSFKVSMGNDDP